MRCWNRTFALGLPAPSLLLTLPIWLSLSLSLASAASAASPASAVGAADAPAAAPAPAETTPDKGLASAKEDFEAAQTLFLKEQYEPAAARFLGAFDKKPFPAFLFNAAVAFEKAKLLEKAKQYFETYLEKDPGATDAAQVKARIDTLNAMLAAPPPPPPAPPAGTTGADATPGAPPAAGTGETAGAAPPAGGAGTSPPGAPAAAPPPLPALPAIDTKGLVVIDSKPQGATIYLNDKKGGAFAKTPWQGSLEPKPVRLLFESKGFKPEQRNISPRPDKLIDIYIALSEEHYLGWVEIISNVPGAEVFIDRKDIGAIGRTPYTGLLKPGKHTVYLARKGYTPTERQLDILPGTATQQTIPLERARNGWVAATGRGTLGARLLVDEKFACNLPCETEVMPGTHAVAVEKEGMETYESSVKVEQALQTGIDVRFSPRPPRTGAIGQGIVALAFIGAGAYVGHLSNQNRDDINAEIKAGRPVDSGDPRFQRGKLEAIGADVLYGVGALVAISAVYSLFAHGPDSVGAVDQKMVGFAPQVGPNGGGVGAFGRF